MIAVNVNTSYRDGMSPDQVRKIGAGDWPNISDASLQEHAAAGEKIIFVARNVMVGAATITGATRTKAGKVVFTLEPDRTLDADVTGAPFPDPWTRGQARPVKYVDPATVYAAVKQARSPQGPPPRTVSLDGFRLTITADGAATLVVPAGRDVTIAARRAR